MTAQEDTTSEMLPEPASTYHLLLDAARTWPDGIATQSVPEPAADAGDDGLLVTS